MPKVAVEPALYERAKRCADEVGYGSVEELIAHAIERAVREIEEPADREALARRLKGLGYIE